MAFSLACANLVCSIKEFIPWLGKKETGNQNELVQMSYISECSPQKCFVSPWKYLLVVLVCSSNTYFAYDPQFPDLGQRTKIPVKCTCKQETIYYGHESVSCCSDLMFFRKLYLAWNTSFLPLGIQVLFFFSLIFFSFCFIVFFSRAISIGLKRSSTFSLLLTASWLVFY